jgi:hypothetical protein
MAGIIDFMTDLGGDRNLSGEFVEKITRPDITQQELKAFFTANDYSDVTDEDVEKLLNHRNRIKEDFGLAPHIDY